MHNRLANKIRLILFAFASFFSLYKKNAVFTALFSALLIAGNVSLKAQPSEIIEVGKFSTANADTDFLSVWKPLTFKKIKEHTLYNLVEDNGVTVVKATSNASASGLIRKIEIDPKLYPVIVWRWKVTKIYEKGDVTKKEGDDYPARIYITFKYEPGKLGFFRKAEIRNRQNILRRISPHCGP